MENKNIRLPYKTPITVKLLMALSLILCLYVVYHLGGLITEGLNYTDKQLMIVKFQALSALIAAIGFGICSIALDHLMYQKHVVNQLKKEQENAVTSNSNDRITYDLES